MSETPRMLAARRPRADLEDRASYSDFLFRVITNRGRIIALLLGLVVLGGGLYLAVATHGVAERTVGIVVAVAGFLGLVLDTAARVALERDRRRAEERIALLEADNAKPIWQRRQEEDLAMFGPAVDIPISAVKRTIERLSRALTPG